MSRWYRAYVGTCQDSKIAEVAFIAEVSRSVAIAVWHIILEGAAEARQDGLFLITPRRIAVLLSEPVATVDRVFTAMTEIGLIEGNLVVKWGPRQYQSDTSTDRVKRFRAKEKANTAVPEPLRNGDETFRNVGATPPDTDTDTERKKDISLPSEARPKQARTLKTRKAYPDDFEAFWKAYPTDANQSKAEALAAWQRLSPDDWQQAIASVPGFVAFCQKDPTYRPIHACRYLAKRRFEGHATGPPVQTVYTLPPLKVLTDEEIEAQMLQAEDEEDARRNSDELPTGSVDLRQVATA